MLKINLLLFAFFLLLFHAASFAQEKTNNNLDTLKFSYFKVGVDYVNNNVYLGRKDSAKIPYLTPEIGYYHRSGLFIEGSLSVIPKAGAGIDLFAIDGGYDFHSNNEKFTGELFAAKYFFNTSSKSVRSEISGETDAIASYNFGPVSLNGGADVLFSSPADLILNAGLSHEFYFGNSDEWAITPTFLTNIGSLNFYKNYYKNRKFKKKRSTRSTPVTVTGKNNFSMLDYEFSLPLYYDINKWSFYISPNYVIPVNPIQYAVNGVFAKQEQLSNSFYLNINAAFDF